MELLVVYDIDTTTAAGERRLRAVAKICEGYGHRVQKSVFECVLDAVQLRQLVHDLEETISPSVDQVGIYRLREPYAAFMVRVGQTPSFDHRKPFVL